MWDSLTWESGSLWLEAGSLGHSALAKSVELVVLGGLLSELIILLGETTSEWDLLSLLSKSLLIGIA